MSHAYSQDIERAILDAFRGTGKTYILYEGVRIPDPRQIGPLGFEGDKYIGEMRSASEEDILRFRREMNSPLGFKVANAQENGSNRQNEEGGNHPNEGANRCKGTIFMCLSTPDEVSTLASVFGALSCHEGEIGFKIWIKNILDVLGRSIPSAATILFAISNMGTHDKPDSVIAKLLILPSLLSHPLAHADIEIDVPNNVITVTLKLLRTSGSELMQCGRIDLPTGTVIIVNSKQQVSGEV
ncbi:MAG: hypothetical protein N3A71_00995 [Candidatus Dojkabacteria bacterium]|nr:hypothetical protein [Candidatus Dojkabacteria bacterium]